MSILTPVLFVALSSPAFADAKPEELIVGKWENKQKENDVEVTTVMEFTKDGKFSIVFNGPGPTSIGAAGTYKVLDANTLEVEFKMGAMTSKTKGKFKVTKDKLTATDNKGKATEFTRIKE